MSGVVRGERELLKELERRFGQQAAQRISDKALKRAAQRFLITLKRAFESFRDKGYSIEEMTLTEPMWIAGVRVIKVRWRGPHGRYRIIHLNEFGTVKNPNPDGKGVISRTLKNAERTYREDIKKALLEGG